MYSFVTPKKSIIRVIRGQEKAILLNNPLISLLYDKLARVSARYIFIANIK